MTVLTTIVPDANAPVPKCFMQGSQPTIRIDMTSEFNHTDVLPALLGDKCEQWLRDFAVNLVQLADEWAAHVASQPIPYEVAP